LTAPLDSHAKTPDKTVSLVAGCLLHGGTSGFHN
jgi:hypothetical protein